MRSPAPTYPTLAMAGFLIAMPVAHADARGHTGSVRSHGKAAVTLEATNYGSKRGVDV
jgi:hypothetical protein